MLARLRVRVCLAALLVGASIDPSASRADEGQWMPEQLGELGQQLRKQGLQLGPEELYNDDDGGLMAAVVNLSGCSAGFVSPKGLVSTNHHCAYGAIQAQSSVEHDYLTDGFLATALGDELPAKGRTVRVLQSIEDVTKQVRDAVHGESDPAQRAKVADRTQKEIESKCEAEGEGLRCSVAGFYEGSEFRLFRFLELPDVRIVYAPPSSVGNYGGEVDNWMWPRHSGDFTLLRAYVGPDGKPAPYSEDNVPYEPRRWLEPSPEGVAPGDFVAVLGYPGHTDRHLWAAEVKRHLEQFLPARIDLYGEWIEILERAGAEDPATKIKVAATLRSLANRHKNARGMMEGIREIGVLEDRRREEEAMAAWAAAQEDPKYAETLRELDALSKQRTEGFGAAFLIHNATRAGNALHNAIDLVRRAKERRKPDVDRPSTYMDRNEARLRSQIEGRVRDFDRDVDTQLGAAWLGRVAALPGSDRFTEVTPRQLPTMLRRTVVVDEAKAAALFDATWDQIEASRDPMIVWARELVDATEAQEAREDVERGKLLVLGPRWFDMLKAVRSGPVYPDANSTLRLSYATMQGYSPRDGMQATPQTTVSGQVAKHKGQDPFDLPEAVREAAPKASQTYWADPGLGDVPVAFLSNADTTGGNSGSPVIDGKGRWVGQNFDRVWENIAGDFGWRQDRSRNISVDVRYILWTLDEVAGAKALLEELGVADKADAGPRPRTGKPLSPPTGDIGVPLPNKDEAAQVEPTTAGATSRGCGCRSPGGDTNPLAWFLALSLVLRRRRVRGAPHAT